MSEDKIYSIVLDETGEPQIIEGITYNAIFTGTHDECQAEILMIIILD